MCVCTRNTGIQHGTGTVYNMVPVLHGICVYRHYLWYCWKYRTVHVVFAVACGIDVCMSHYTVVHAILFIYTSFSTSTLYVRGLLYTNPVLSTRLASWWYLYVRTLPVVHKVPHLHVVLTCACRNTLLYMQYYFQVHRLVQALSVLNLVMQVLLHVHVVRNYVCLYM